MRYFAHRILRRALVAVLAVAVGLPLVVSATPTAVTLIFFDTVGVENGVLLRWETGTEFNTGGFLVRRAPAANPNNPPPDSEFVLMTQFGSGGNGYIPARGQGGTGALYEFTDTTATLGDAYWYRLIEVETNNTQTNLQDNYVIAGAAPTATPQALATDTPQPAEATATRTPTHTPTPTNTSIPPTVPPGTTATPTTIPTNTPLPSPTTPSTASPVPPTPTSAPSGPTATPFVFPTAVDGDEENSGGSGAVAEAAGQVDDPYPAPGDDNGPAAESGDTPAQEAYPGAAPGGDTGDAIDFAYPADQSSNPNVPINPVGPANGDDLLPPPIDAPVQQSATEGDNTLLLWLGFTGALLLFGGGIYGATILYNRQRQAPPESE